VVADQDIIETPSIIELIPAFGQTTAWLGLGTYAADASLTQSVVVTTPSNTDIGDYTYSIKLWDYFSPSVTVPFNWKVKENYKPVVDSPANIGQLTYTTTAYMGANDQTITYSDAEGETISITYANLPAFLTLGTGDTWQDSPASNADSGVYKFSFIMNDHHNPVNSFREISWTIEYNSVPYLDASLANQSTRVTLADTYTMPTYTDKEGETVTVTIGGAAPAFITYSPTTRIFNIAADATSAADLTGGSIFTVSVLLTDGHQTSTVPFTWKIIPNVDPVIDVVADRSFIAYYSDSVTVNISDADGDSLT
jgi:hypothetical protein